MQKCWHEINRLVLHICLFIFEFVEKITPWDVASHFQWKQFYKKKKIEENAQPVTRTTKPQLRCRMKMWNVHVDEPLIFKKNLTFPFKVIKNHHLVNMRPFCTRGDFCPVWDLVDGSASEKRLYTVLYVDSWF